MAKNKNTGENIYDLIYEIVRHVPKGRVTTYGARLVGYAMNGCHTIRPEVPAHRVVNRKGLLTGKHHFGSPTMMQELLEKEGIKVKDDQVTDFEKLFWDPLLELNI